MRRRRLREEDDGAPATVTARAPQGGDGMAAGEGISGKGEGSGGARCQPGAMSACLDNARLHERPVPTRTKPGAAQSAATSMPSPCSPRCLAPGGHASLPNLVWHVDLRSLRSPTALVWLGSRRDERYDHQQFLTADLWRFWRRDEVEIEPKRVSGVMLIRRTPNWQNLRGFG